MSERVRSESGKPVLSVQILSWNTVRLTTEALDALAHDVPEHSREILVLDNGSEDETASIVGSRADIRFVRSEDNTGYARGNNLLARHARGEFVCFLGSDTRVHEGALDALVRFLEGHAEYGAAAPRLVDIARGDDPTSERAASRVQRTCMRFPTIATALVYDMAWKRWPVLRRFDDRYHYRDFDHEHDADVEQPPGTCLVMRRALFEELGGFDEELWLFFNDVDLCKRIHDRGLRIRYLADPIVEHHLGASTFAFGPRLVLWARNRRTYYLRHYGWLGAAFVGLMTRLRGVQEWFDIGRKYRDVRERREARAELRRIVRAALSKKPTI
ncbi:MAG: glycosyltransferase family 2 protein [Planctomycetes bacterium]|nr:glycosyltransferase family 2 protein [Planctomycetota bacterium]MCB9918074.1 glycosyltransferase family 2 protein [Planctomycetota bacterium]